MTSPDALLATLRDCLSRGPAPVPLTDERFDEAHERFETSSDQQRQILAWLTRHCRDWPATPAGLSILSVGCGSGILDLPLIGTLAGRPGGVAYTGFDPNRTACDRFAQGFAASPAAGVRLDVLPETLDGFAGGSFDLIYAAHSLYYVPDVPAAVERLVGMLRPGGKLVAFHAPRGEMNELADCFWQTAGGDTWYSDRLRQHLDAAGYGYTMQAVLGRLDASGDCGLLLDFLIQADASQLSDEVRGLCRDYLRAIGYEENGRLYVPHPVDAFIVEAAGDRGTSPGPT